jgi:hypothetical protein
VKQVYIAILLAFIYSVEAQENPCEGFFTGNIPHPDYCYKYYSCYMQIPTEHTCGPNTIFTTLFHTCMPGNQDTCELYSETTTTTTLPTTTLPETTTSAPGIDLNAICRNVFFAARPHPESNLLYVGCMRGMGLVYQCLEKEEFDEDINECVKICEVDQNICVGDPRVRVIENPCNCSSFVVCYNEGIVAIQSCADGNIFDVEHGE